MEQQEPYRFIWIAGNRTALLAGVREHLKLRNGEGAVLAEQGFIWNGAEIAIRFSPTFDVVISIPVKGVQDATSWNEELRNFYEQVVRPVADRTGGVATGLSEPGIECAL